jgi:hypothetical protein
MEKLGTVVTLFELRRFFDSHSNNIKFSAENLVGSGHKATPSLQNGSYRPGKPLLDQRPNGSSRVLPVKLSKKINSNKEFWEG